MVGVEADLQADDWAILLKDLVELYLFHGLGYVFDEDLAGHPLGVVMHDVLFKPESSTLLARDFEVPYFLAHLNVIFEFLTANLHVASEKLFFDVPLDYWDFVQYDASLLLHYTGQPMGGVFNLWQVVQIDGINNRLIIRLFFH